MNNESLSKQLDEARERGALVYSNTENCVSDNELYHTEKTSLFLKPADFHKISGDKYSPTRATVDRIGEAAGVVFIAYACRVYTETREDPICGKRNVFRATAQGKVQMTDGLWRESTVDEYEFDPVLRAMLDKNVTALDEKTMPIVGRLIMEYGKVGRQRAATGARERVIRQLTAMPAAFSAGDINREFVFTRVVLNTGHILQTPEGRALATAKALDMDVASLFGGRKESAAPFPATTAAAADPVPPDNGGDNVMTPAATPDFADDAGGAAPASEFDRLTNALSEFIEGYKTELNVCAPPNGINPYEKALAEMGSKEATVETRRWMIERLREFLSKKGINV
jgi:hypothetical protein